VLLLLPWPEEAMDDSCFGMAFRGIPQAFLLACPATGQKQLTSCKVLILLTNQSLNLFFRTLSEHPTK
jgi:hypothetical protein